MIEALIRDLRYATRGLARTPASSLEIVGVAADIRPTDAAKDSTPTIFLPVETSRGFAVPTYAVRTRVPLRRSFP